MVVHMEFRANRKVPELVEIQPVIRDHVPVVRRFSGGGTVIVDQVATVSSRHHVMDRPAVW